MPDVGRKDGSNHVPSRSSEPTPTLNGHTYGQKCEVLPAGTQVGRFVVKCPLGGGGMGDVYLAHDPALDRDVALKMIRSDLVLGRSVGAFLREARTTAQFSHPNIVVIHEVGEHQGQPFLALEYLDGPTLRKWLAQAAPSLEEVLRVVLEVAQALVAAHERGIIHRDLKPSNVIVAKDGRARVVDFGLAAALGDQATGGGGTPGYMAPEQQRGEVQTPAVDIWALGLILKQLLEQRFEPTQSTRSTPGTPSGSRNQRGEPSLPPALDDLLRAATQEDPKLRPDAPIFRDAIARQLEELKVEHDLAETRRLLGRDDERAGLLERASALREGGRGGILGIEGEAGLGKTLLLLDFVRRVKATGLRVVSGTADAIHRHTPFHAWSDALRDLLEGDEPQHDTTNGASRPRLPDELQPFLPILETVLRTSEASSWANAVVDFETRAEVTARVLTEVISRLATKPLVVVIDDWQWADSASWRLARSVALHIPHLLLVLCYRPVDPASPEKVALERLPRFESIKLPPLTDRTVRCIVESRTSSAESTGELTRLVVQHAAGNPLFAEELTALAQHSGTAGLSAETTLQSVIRQRLDALGPEVLDVLLTASVVGRHFDQNLLHKLHDTSAVRTALDRLLALGLIRRAERGYAFWHDLTRSATYERLQGEELRSRHRAVAGALESLGGEAARHHGALADHWHAAGDLERAVRHADLAAEQALHAGAFKEAVRFLRRCLHFRPQAASRSLPPEQAMRWRRLLAESYYALGRLKEAREEALRVLALAGRELPSSHLQYRLATGRLLLHALSLTGSSARERLAGSRGQPWQLEMARALGTAAVASWFFNEADPTHYAALASFCEAYRCGPSRTLVRSSSRLGCELGLRGWQWAGARFERLAREVAAELEDAPATAYVCLTDALYRVGVGDWERVQYEVSECQRICEEIRDDTNWCNAQAVRYWTYHYRGMSAEAWRAAQDLSERAETTGNDQHRGWGARDLALEMLDGGDPEAARRTLGDALCLLTSAGRRIELIPARGALSVAWMRLGEPDRAVEEASETLSLLRHSKSLTSHVTLEGCSGVAEVLLTAQCEGWPHKTPAGWHRAVDQALGILRAYSVSFPIGLPRHALWRGVAASNRGREARARRWWQRGLHDASRLDLRRDVRMLSERLAGNSRSQTRV